MLKQGVEHRRLTSEAEMVQAIQEVVKTHLGIEMHVAPSLAQVWLERIPLILSALIVVVGLYWCYGLGQ